MSALILVLVALATARLFIWPVLDRPAPADAVILLAGGRGERVERALRLMDTGLAPILVHVGQPTEPLADELCRNVDGREFQVVCLRPHPVDNTRTAARAIAGLAAERGWRRLIVVTTTYHVTRSRMLFERCFHGTVLAVAPQPPFGGPLLAKVIAEEWLAVVHALAVARGC